MNFVVWCFDIYKVKLENCVLICVWLVRSRQSLQLNFPALSQSFSRPTQSKDVSNLGRSLSRPVQSRDSSPCPTQVFGRSSPCPMQVFGRSSPCPTLVFGRSSPCPTQIFGRSSPCPTQVFGQSTVSQESSQWFGRSLPTKDLFTQPKDLVQRPTLNFIRSSASRESSPGPTASVTCAKNAGVLASRGHPTQMYVSEIKWWGYRFFIRFSSSVTVLRCYYHELKWYYFSFL